MGRPSQIRRINSPRKRHNQRRVCRQPLKQTLLFFPSGAIYPIEAFPKWLRAIAIVDPFTYAVHGFKAILIKDGGFAAIQKDVLFLFGFGIISLLLATPLFKRTL